MREGYEGLVRGNKGGSSKQRSKSTNQLAADDEEVVEELHSDDLVQNLRFGDGELLREGSGDSAELVGGRTMQGRYIIRVGWDDVRGWFSEVRRISE